MKGHSLAPRFPHPRLLPSQVLLSAAPGAGAVADHRLRVVSGSWQLQGKGVDISRGGVAR